MGLGFRARKERAILPGVGQLLQELVTPTFVLDRDRKVVVWNKAAEELTGITASEVLGTSNHWQAFYEHERPCLADLLFQEGTKDVSGLYAVGGKSPSNKNAMTVENWCTMPKRGRRAYLAIDASAVRDATGALQAVVETLRDMTAEQEAKAALKVQQEAQAREVEQQLAQACATLGHALNALARGDLTCVIRKVLPGPLDALRGDFNAAVERLAEVLQQTTSLARTIGDGSAEIAQSADQLSARTEQQAANLEETSAALQQIMVQVNTTTKGAVHARKVVAATAENTARSQKVVDDAVSTMSRVEASSGKIGQIIGVIDEIALQTNLLALNAGVEAARAGESGRGFAVVASEVRALAQRSAEAAKEIKALIVAAAEEVDLGVSLVAQTGEALKTISTQVGEVDKVVNEVSAAAEDQASSLGEISTAISQMDQMTQRNASMVIETNTVTRELLERTGDLGDMLSQFRFDRQPAATKSGASVHELRRRLSETSFGPPRSTRSRAK